MPRLSALARVRDVELAGSLLAAPPDSRTSTAQRLAAAGHWVHADVIQGSYREQPGGQAGLADRELAALGGLAHVLDVHLMVDEPADVLGRLPVRPRRLTVQLRDLRDAHDLVARARRHATQVWLAVERVAPEDVEALEDLAPDGVLVLLTPPGRGGQHADLQRLEAAVRLRPTSMSVGVDGGVTADTLPPAADAGVRYAVSGRALVAELDGAGR